MDEAVRLIPGRFWVQFLLRHILPQSMNMHIRLIGDSKMPKMVFMISRNRQMS